jgi:hypothetical protein
MIEAFSTEELLNELERRLAPLVELPNDTQSMLYLMACEMSGGDVPVEQLPTSLARWFLKELDKK